MNVREIIEAIIDAEAIVFLGAGFSVGATNFTEEGKFLTGKALCKKLISDGNIDVEGEEDEDIADLHYISTRYLENNTSRDLLRLLKDLYCCQNVKQEHEIIAGLPWRRIYTTNYDDVMEVASKNASCNRQSVTAKSKIAEVYGKTDTIVHINGYINNVKEEDLLADFKLTQESYRKRTISDSDWAIALHSDIKSSKAVVFIGYSLDYDIELQQIFACDETLKNKCLFVDLNPSRRKLTTMEMYGNVYKEGMEAFSRLVEETCVNYQSEKKEYKFKCLIKSRRPEKLAINIDLKDLMQLFVDGRINDEILFSSLENKYLFERTCTEQIYNFIKEKGKVVIIHSDLSNGKSVLVKQLETKLFNEGNVFWLDDRDRDGCDLALDLEQLSGLKGCNYIIVENYNQIIEGEYWEIIRRYQYSNVKYIFTARSYINDNFYSRVIRDMELGYESIWMFDINELKDADIKNFSALIAGYGLWADNYTKSLKANQNYIKKECKAEIKNVLLKLYDSKAVKDKINALVAPLLADEMTRKVLLFSLISNILAVSVEIDDIAIVLGINSVNELFFNKNASLKELILIDRNKLKIKSSNVSTYIIQRGNYNDEIVDIVNLMVNCFVRNSYNTRYRNILKYIVSFSNLRLIFNRDDKTIGEKYRKIYENARKTGYYNNNQFFWIQYAIGVMEMQDYDSAEVFLRNASALSNKKFNEDSYQVDSLRARLLLEKTLNMNDKKNAYINFKEAHRLICSNKTPERHYPYRQASAYIEFYYKFYAGFSQNEKVEFMFMCIEMKKSIDSYLNINIEYEKNVRKRNAFIKRISRDLDMIISKMSELG